jgi:hypothetical protein
VAPYAGRGQAERVTQRGGCGGAALEQQLGHSGPGTPVRRRGGNGQGLFHNVIVA